jgi:hypothetical protein
MVPVDKLPRPGECNRFPIRAAAHARIAGKGRKGKALPGPGEAMTRETTVHENTATERSFVSVHDGAKGCVVGGNRLRDPDKLRRSPAPTGLSQ